MKTPIWRLDPDPELNKERKMGFDNIREHDGLGIAATGIIIVFTALTLISLFVALLPRLLQALSFLLPTRPELQQPSQRQSIEDDQVVAAIGFVLHQIEVQKKPDQKIDPTARASHTEVDKL